MDFKVEDKDCGPPAQTLNATHPMASANLRVFLRNHGVPLLLGVSKAPLSVPILLEFIHHAHFIWISMLPPTQQQMRSSWELLEILIAFYFESLSSKRRGEKNPSSNVKGRGKELND